MADAMLEARFLNHLRGGELYRLILAASTSFLNHLRGGELKRKNGIAS